MPKMRWPHESSSPRGDEQHRAQRGRRHHRPPVANAQAPGGDHGEDRRHGEAGEAGELDLAVLPGPRVRLPTPVRRGPRRGSPTSAVAHQSAGERTPWWRRARVYAKQTERYAVLTPGQRSWTGWRRSSNGRGPSEVATTSSEVSSTVVPVVVRKRGVGGVPAGGDAHQRARGAPGRWGRSTSQRPSTRRLWPRCGSPWAASRGRRPRRAGPARRSPAGGRSPGGRSRGTRPGGRGASRTAPSVERLEPVT